MLNKLNDFLTSIPGFIVGAAIILLPNMLRSIFNYKMPAAVMRIFYVAGIILLLYSIIMFFIKKR